MKFQIPLIFFFFILFVSALALPTVDNSLSSNIVPGLFNITAIISSGANTTVKIEITYPNNTKINYSMNDEYWRTLLVPLPGNYIYKIFVSDNIGNNIVSEFDTNKSKYYFDGKYFLTENNEVSQETGINGSLALGGSSVETTGWSTTSNTKCTYESYNKYIGEVSVVCSPDAFSKSISYTLNTVNTSFRGEIGFMINELIGGYLTPYFNIIHNSGTLAIDTTSCDINPVGRSTAGWMSLKFDFTDDGILFYKNNTLCRNLSGIQGLQGFGFSVYGTTAIFYFDDFYVVSSQRLRNYAFGQFNSSYIPYVPVITVYSPLTNVTANVGTSVNFDIEVSDNNTEDLFSYVWIVDNIEVAVTEDYVFNIQNSGNITHNISVTVTDDSVFYNSASYVWKVTSVGMVGYQSIYAITDLTNIVIDAVGTAGASGVVWIDILIIVLFLMLIVYAYVYLRK